MSWSSTLPVRALLWVGLGLLNVTAMAAPITFVHTAEVDSAVIDGVGYTDLVLKTTVYADDSVSSDGSGKWTPAGGWDFAFNFLGVKDLGRSTSHNVVSVTQAAGTFLFDISGTGTGITIVSGIDWIDINQLGSLLTDPDTGLTGNGSYSGRFVPSGTFEFGTAASVYLTDDNPATLSVSSSVPLPAPWALLPAALVALRWRGFRGGGAQRLLASLPRHPGRKPEPRGLGRNSDPDPNSEDHSMKRFVSALIGSLALASTAAFAGPYSSAVLADNPMAYWQFNETSGTHVADATGNGYDGTMNLGTINTTTGIDGTGGYQMDGSDDYIRVSNAGDFQFTNQSVTLEAWVQIADNSNVYRQFFYLGGTSGPSYLELGKARSGSINGGIYFQFPSNSTRSSDDPDWTGPNMPKNEWLHLVGVLDVAESQLSMYINGELIDQLNGIGPYDLSTVPDFDVILGSSQNSFCCHSTPNAPIDEFAIYDYALSVEQIEEHYNIGSGNASASVPVPGSLGLALLGLVFPGLALPGLNKRRRSLSP